MSRHKNFLGSEERSKGLTISFAAHAALILCLLIGMPAWLKSAPMELPPVLVVEIVDVADVTNVKPTPPRAKPKKAEQPKPEPKKEVEPEPALPKPEPEPTSPPPPDKKPAEKKPKPKEKPKKKPKPTKKQPKPKTPDKTQKRSFDEILKDLAKEAKTEASNEPEVRGPAQYDASKPLSVNHISYIQSKMAQCWQVPAGIANARNLAVKLKMQMLPNGSVRDVWVVDRMRMASDPQFRVAAESAVRAVRLCSPFDKLPADRYPSWKEIEMNFDPSAMLY